MLNAFVDNFTSCGLGFNSVVSGREVLVISTESLCEVAGGVCCFFKLTLFLDTLCSPPFHSLPIQAHPHTFPGPFNYKQTASCYLKRLEPYPILHPSTHQFCSRIGIFTEFSLSKTVINYTYCLKNAFLHPLVILSSNPTTSPYINYRLVPALSTFLFGFAF